MKLFLIVSLCMSFSAFGMDWQAIVEGEERTGKMLDAVVKERREIEKELAQAQAAVQRLEKQTPQDESDRLKKIAALERQEKMSRQLQGAIAENAVLKESAIELYKKTEKLHDQVDSLQKESIQLKSQLSALHAASNRQGFYTQVLQVSVFAVPFLAYLIVRHAA